MRLRITISLSLLLTSCSNPISKKAPLHQEVGVVTTNISIARDYLKGTKFAFTYPEEYSFSATENLLVIPHKDTLEIRALDYGAAELVFYNNTDTFLRYEVEVVKNKIVDSAVSLLQTGNPFIYRNYELSSWMADYRLINKPLPKFAASLIDGRFINQQSFLSKISFINFWFYGCPPCMAELPLLRAAADVLKENNQYQLYSFFKDSAYIKDDNTYFYSKQGSNKSVFQKLAVHPLICAMKTGRLSEDFLFHGYPTSFIVDKKGIIRYTFAGAPPDIDKQIILCMKFLNHRE